MKSRELMLALTCAAGLALGPATSGCVEKHARVEAKDAPVARGRSLTLDHARIAFDAGGRYDRICAAFSGGRRCIDHHFYVFPVVSTAADARTGPVPAWVTCSDNETSFEECEKKIRTYRGEITGTVAVRLDKTDKVSGWEKAANEAAERHGLTVIPAAPVIRLGKR